MSKLQEFLNKNRVDGITAEVIVSKRLQDENGDYFKFKIKAMTEKDLQDARIKATKRNKSSQEEVNEITLNHSIVINNTLDPCFKDAKSIDELNAGTPENYLSKILLPGEISTLSSKIFKLSGFDRSFEELAEEAKN